MIHFPEPLPGFACATCGREFQSVPDVNECADAKHRMPELPYFDDSDLPADVGVWEDCLPAHQLNWLFVYNAVWCCLPAGTEPQP